MRNAVGKLLELRQLMKSEAKEWDWLSTWTFLLPSPRTGNGVKKKTVMSTIKTIKFMADSTTQKAFLSTELKEVFKISEHPVKKELEKY